MSIHLVRVIEKVKKYYVNVLLDTKASSAEHQTKRKESPPPTERTNCLFQSLKGMTKKELFLKTMNPWLMPRSRLPPTRCQTLPPLPFLKEFVPPNKIDRKHRHYGTSPQNKPLLSHSKTPTLTKSSDNQEICFFIFTKKETYLLSIEVDTSLPSRSKFQGIIARVAQTIPAQVIYQKQMPLRLRQK